MTASNSSLRYHGLPGRRRGFISSASLWTAPDHLLSVKSDRLHEHYKRFYFRDIQAIVITKAPRFAVSTRAAALGMALLTGILVARLSYPVLMNALWLLAAGLIALWIYLSATQSCVCWLYTAVSREKLPSIYRLWNARKILAELEPRIAQTQGVFTESWAEAAELCSPGPPEKTPDLHGRHPGAARNRTLASDAFLATLFADALVQAGSPGMFLAAVSTGLTLLQLGAAIWIFIQHYRGILATAMQRLALATLIFMGAITYMPVLSYSIQVGLGTRRRMVPIGTLARSELVHPIYIAGVLLLGLTGLVLSFKSSEPESPPAIIK